jgi:hypothetical protein
MFAVTQTKLAFIGGFGSDHVYILEINESGRITDDRDTDMYLYNERDNYQMYEVARLPYDCPVLFPVLFDPGRDTVFIMTGKKGYEKLHVVKYGHSNFSELTRPRIPRKFGRIY